MNRACKNCKHFGTGAYETTVEGGFYRSIDGIEKYDQEKRCFVSKEGQPRLTYIIRNDAWWIEMCCHPVCFTKVKVKDPEDGKSLALVRINGQGILNRNNDCKYYERKFWKFWVQE